MNNPIDDINEISNVLAMLEELDPDSFKELRYQTYLYGIIAAVYNCGSIQVADIVDEIYTGFNKMISIEDIQYIVETILPDIINDTTLLDDGVLSQDGIEIAIKHNELMGRVKPSKKHLH